LAGVHEPVYGFWPAVADENGVDVDRFAAGVRAILA
jgi:hypothetical protein